MAEHKQLPYASELFGVYQPLLGWKSNQAKRRVTDERCKALDALLQEVGRDPTFDNNPDFLIVDLSQATHTRASCFDSLVAGTMAAKVTEFIGTDERGLSREEWQAFYENFNAPNTENLSDWLSQAETILFNAPRPPGTSQDPPGIIAQVRKEIVAASILTWLGTQLSPTAPMDAVNLLNKLFPPRQSDWEILSHFVDPLADFAKLEVADLRDQLSGDVVLSPVGLVYLYRQYFFETASFLGPPVGHVWLSPGGTVELVEVNTRKTITERTVEATTESAQKSELTRTEQDELSDAVKEENSQDTKLGVGVAAGVNTGIYQASANASFSQDTARKAAHEATHKQMRQQSEKLSSEIRSNFKTTFRTTTEVTDTSSRRYVVQNTTNKLVNYELRRKMREVSVQVQHVGTQLCWQVYLDEMGRSIGLGELVHVASPSDAQSSIQPPELIPPLKPVEQKVTVNFLFRTARQDKIGSDSGQDYFNDDAVPGTAKLGDDRHGGDRIFNEQTFIPPPPASGYVLSLIRDIDTHGAHANPIGSVDNATNFRIRLLYANFGNQYQMPLETTLVWTPTPQAQSDIDTQNRDKLKAADEKNRREAHIQYVQSVRERVKLAGNVKKRESTDLREEERTVVYRSLIEQLMQARPQPTQAGSTGDTARHVTAELIRSLFDVDKMLYFVAPDWWKPRTHYHNDPGNTNPSTPLTEEDLTSWGGSRAKDPNRDNYLITEETTPAPLGSSLGWLIQLDGDNHRNAFLNSPWVKAIIPILPGRELAALAWLQLAHVEGDDGLGLDYLAQESDPPKYKTVPPPTIGEALAMLAEDLKEVNTSISSYLKTETVFQNGFDPLVTGFRDDADTFVVFDNWTEILPTDQIVAVEVEYDPKTGLQV